MTTSTRKYVLYRIDPKTRTVKVDRAYYGQVGRYRFALAKDAHTGHWIAVDVWSGFPIFGSASCPREEVAAKVEENLPRIREIYKMDVRRRLNGSSLALPIWNDLLRSSIPEDGAKMPEVVRDYIFGDPDFFNEEE